MEKVCRDLRINLRSDDPNVVTNAARTFLLMGGIEYEEYFKPHDNVNGTNSLGPEAVHLCYKKHKPFRTVESQFASSKPVLVDEAEFPAEFTVRWPDESTLPDVLTDGQDNGRYFDSSKHGFSSSQGNGASSNQFKPVNATQEEPPSVPAFKSARTIIDPNAKIGGSNNNAPAPKKKASGESGLSERHAKYAYVLDDERIKGIDSNLVGRILDELIVDCKDVTWESIAGLKDVKSRIQEMVVLPMLRPDLFTGIRAPGKGLLLFGPPGTGKTMIGKCIASQSQATFFNISSASLTSKWVGEGEKMVKAMFVIARIMAPTVIFMDEIDSLLLARSDSDHESSRRMKTEFLLQFDGCGTDDEERLLIVGATNRPEGLDEAARRRFTKRLYIPLPDQPARIGISRALVADVKADLSEADYEKIATMTEGYSGSDMKRVCGEASMIALREEIAVQGDLKQVNKESIRPLKLSDFEKAVRAVKTSVAQAEIVRYEKFNEEFGALDI